MKNIIKKISLKRINFKTIDKILTELPVSEIMKTDIKSLKSTDSVQKAIDYMALYSISGILIENGENLPIGIVSEGDIIKKVLHLKKDPKKVKLNDIMTKHLLTISPKKSIGETSAIMKKYNISKLPIVENNKMIGYVTKSDLLEKLNEIYYQNTRLKWLPIVFLIQLIIIAILILMYLKK